MFSVTEATHRNGRSLQDSLNRIFLAIGNAYYEANMAIKAPKGSSGPSLFADCDAQIKTNKATFLDSLDQLEILTLRATEVLERRARQVQREAPYILPTNLPVVGTMTAGETNESSPETTLLTGQSVSNDKSGLMVANDIQATLGSLDTSDAISFGLGTDGAQNFDTMAVNSEHDKTNGASSTTAELSVPVANEPTPAVDAQPSLSAPEDLMALDGPIDFGDMMFDNFNFDDTTQFDFGSMMED